MTDEIASLTAELLAQKLHDLGRFDRLLRLFADDHWVGRRVRIGDLGWTGYQADLEFAWEALLDRTLEAEIQDDLEVEQAACRLALIGSTVASVRVVPPALVAAAVRTKRWTLDRGLAEIAAYSSATRRCEGYVDLIVDGERGEEEQVLKLLEDEARTTQPPVSGLLLSRILDSLGAESRARVGPMLANAGIASTAADRELASARREVPPALLQEIVALLERWPELRSPSLIQVLVDKVLVALEELAGEAPEDEEPAEEETPGLLGLGWRAGVAAVYGTDARRIELLEAFVRLAPFLDSHPTDPFLLWKAVENAQGKIEDPGLRKRIHAAQVAARRSADPPPALADSSPSTEEDVRGPASDRHLRLMRELILRRGAEAPSSLDPAFALWDAEALQKEWLAFAVPNVLGDRPRAADTSGEAEESAETRDEKARVSLEKTLVRLSMPSLAAALATKWDFQLAEIDEFVEESFDPIELDGQLFMTHQVGEDREEIKPALRRVRGALLAAAMKRAGATQTISNCWVGLNDELLAEVDWAPVVDAVVDLPMRHRRDSLHRLTGSFQASPETVPFIQGLRLALPHVSQEHVHRLFEAGVDATLPEVRRVAMEVVASRLDATQVAAALDLLRSPADASARAGVLAALAGAIDRETPQSQQVWRWAQEAAEAMGDGLQFGRLMARRLQREEGGLDPILEQIAAMDVPDRVDALITLALAHSEEVPATLAVAILQLPVSGAPDPYSPRADALCLTAEKFPQDALEEVWEAVKELPSDIPIGDSQIWGWHWSFEFPLAAAINVLAPRLSEEQAFEAVGLVEGAPWYVREEVLLKLADGAHSKVAQRIFDCGMARHSLYVDLAEDAELPLELENSFVTVPIGQFKVEREAQLAEILAATAENLDPPRLARAAEQAVRFEGEGPRAWLPSRLLPWLNEESYEPMLSSAALAAQAFVIADPRRLDMLTDLLPYMDREIARRRAPYDAFVQSRFPGHEGIPTPAQISSLPLREQRELRELLGVQELEPAVLRGEDPPEAEQRAILERMVLSPFSAETLEERIAGHALSAPLESRVLALPQLKDFLAEDRHQKIVDGTVEELRQSDLRPEAAAAAIDGLLPHLDEDRADAILELVLGLPGPPVADSEERGRRAAESLVRDFTRSLRQGSGREQLQLGAFAMALAEDMDRQQFRSAFEVRQPRVSALAALVPKLGAHGLERMSQALESFGEVERADALVAVLPDASEPLRTTLVEAIRRLEDPFARFWALFNTQDELDLEQYPWLTGFAREGVFRFEDPLTRIGILLLLVGRAGKEGGDEWCELALAEADRLEDRDRARAAVSVARIAKAGVVRGKVLDCLGSCLPSERFRGVLGLCRVEFECDRTALRDIGMPAAVDWLRCGSAAPRSDLLENLEEATPLLAALLGDDGLFEIAATVQDVCVDWKWP